MTTYTWDPVNSNINKVSLSNNNLTVTCDTDGTDTTFVSLFTKTSGKIYWEIVLGDMTSQYQSFGICHRDNGFLTSTRSGWGESWAYMLSGRYYHNGSYTTAGVGGNDYDTLMFALDIDAGNFWVGKNGTWNGGADPATAAGPHWSDQTINDYPIYLVGTLRYNPDEITGNFIPVDLSYSPPAGFSAVGQAPYSIKGTAPEGARVLLIDEESWEVEGTVVVSGTDTYEFETNNNTKTIVAVKDGRRLTGYNGLVPVPAE